MLIFGSVLGSREAPGALDTRAGPESETASERKAWVRPLSRERGVMKGGQKKKKKIKKPNAALNGVLYVGFICPRESPWKHEEMLIHKTVRWYVCSGYSYVTVCAYMKKS